jgi:hypothetical protein
MKRKKRTVWVIMHYEFLRYMGGPKPYVDSVQFHVSSSLTKAEKYIRDTHVGAHSWWQVHAHGLDAEGYDERTEGNEVYYYSHRGTRLKSPPYKRAKAAFQKQTDV